MVKEHYLHYNMYCTSNERFECSLSIDVFNFEESEEVNDYV